jgi:hypothetical protein
MKKLFSILVIVLMASCAPDVVENCGCGKVESKYQPSKNIPQWSYSFTCNGETVSFYSTKNVAVGQMICQ